ncbi:MAG TPA: AAA family ATPase [Thermoanaerobaculia bacterium]|nr:AAA family ATPase [Thermoanaerobaculia bacterium]
MIVTHLNAKNWRNFRRIDVDLREREFIVGPNASGKSNFLDVFRFLRDIAKSEGGGLQKAIKDRGGVSKVRSLAARKDPEISIEISLAETGGQAAEWRYALGVRQEERGRRLPLVSYERVWHHDQQLLDRPNKDDDADPQRLTQTYLEQIGSNADFREISRFLQTITYLHLVPQLLRYADQIQGRIIEDDPFGQAFLERIAKTTEKRQKARLRVIEDALKIAVPQLQQLQFVRDQDTGRPHLQALYSHWRPNAGWQREDQFSDGTLRLIGLLWSLLDGDSMLLLEEPEQSLNAGIVAQLAPIIHRVQKSRRRQVIVSTHSDDLLNERGIDGREVLMLLPAAEGTEVTVASDIVDVRALLEAGFTAGEAILPRTNPPQTTQLSLLD